jgi:hypothetical protein
MQRAVTVAITTQVIHRHRTGRNISRSGGTFREAATAVTMATMNCPPIRFGV